MNKSLLKSAIAAAAIAAAANAQANEKVAMLIPAATINDIENAQEYAAANYFRSLYADGTVIATGETEKIDASKVDVIWVHIDRCGLGLNNLPAEYDEATIGALKAFVENGGNLFLSKQATQLVHKMGRIDAAFAPGIYGDGEGGKGTDVWTVNAEIGFINKEADPTQYYDRSNHAIYSGLEVNNDFGHPTFGLLGTGDGTEMHREDHNCMWDLNAYSYTAEGANTVEKFENELNAVVLGQWGHVTDYAVAGIVEFAPVASYEGRIIANGLAAYEWAPREGVNGSKGNIEKLTANTLAYLTKTTDAITETEVSADAPAEYFNLQGMAVKADNLTPGLYIVRQGAKTAKVLVK